MADVTVYTWNNANIIWNDNPYTWNEVLFALQILNNGGASLDNVVLQSPDKKRKFIKLLCKVQGQTYEETKDVSDIKISVSDIDLVLSEVLNINIKVNNV